MKSRIIHSLRTAVCGALVLGFTAVGLADDIVDKLAARPEFSTLVTAVTEAGLVDALRESEDITVFAPTNAAFARIPAEDLSALLGDKDALARILLYHIAAGKTPFREFEDGPLPTLLEGESVDIAVKSYFFRWFRQVRVDDVLITRGDIKASNGIIHRINEVLDPGSEPLPSILELAAGNPDLSILAGLVEQAGFASAFQQDHVKLTVFAPTNAAFEALGPETLAAVQDDPELLRSILKNHVAIGARDSDALGSAGSVKTVLGLRLPVTAGADSGTGLAVDGKPIDDADLAARNGIVHVVGEVLLPPTPQSLVDVAASRPDLSTLVFALGEAGLAGTFDRTRKWPAYTIFAPNNAAFEALPPGALQDLLDDPTGALADTLKLHVIQGRLGSGRLFDGQILHTLAGKRLTVSIDEGGVRINNAPVVETDLEAENGVIHILGEVIAPDPFTAADFVAGNRFLSTLEAAVTAAGLGGALDDPEADLTLFAPVNFAFDRLPAGTLESLLETPEGDLTEILLYHVLGESRSADELLDAGSATTLQGADVAISARSFQLLGWRFPFNIVEINGNRVISADISVDNGTVHLIAGVLLPPAGD